MATATEWTEGVEVRRHNGQCSYGDWTEIDDPDVPDWVEQAIADEIAEGRDLDSGRIERGASGWLWRKSI